MAKAPWGREAKAEADRESRDLLRAWEKRALPCGWAAGATTEVVLERGAKALQMSQLPPGEMHSAFMAQKAFGSITALETMLVRWSWDSWSDEVEIRLRCLPGHRSSKFN